MQYGKKRKEIKGIEIGKEEIKLTLFTDNMIVNVEKPKESTQKTNQQINANLASFQNIGSTDKSVSFL